MKNILLAILLIGPPVLFAITIHEFSHGFIADKLGDPTARFSGRLTLNPLAHLDIIGSILVPLILFLASPIILGWAKPVPVNPKNFQNPRKDMLWVALAGPVSNLICGFIFGMLLRGMYSWGLSLFPPEQWDLAIQVIQIIIILNIILAVFNAIPIFPLDGYRILTGVLPAQQAYTFDRFAKYGPFVLLAIILIGQTTRFPIFWMIIGIPVQILYFLFTGQQNLPISN